MSDSVKKKPSAIDMKQLNELAKWLETTGLEEVEIETSGTRVRLRKPGVAVAAVAPAAAVAAPVAAAPAAAAPAAVEASVNAFKSPMVGTFYRASSPDAAPFAKEGDSVTIGQVIGIIEAMKTMNQIEADRAGTVKKVLVANAQAVEFGQPLFIIE